MITAWGTKDGVATVIGVDFGHKNVYLSTGFYKTLCIILACIWLVTLLFFLYRLNLSV